MPIPAPDSNLETAKPPVVSQLSRERIHVLYPGLRSLAFRVLQDCYDSLGRPMNVTDSYRSMDEQLSIYKLGRELTGGTWRIIDPKKIVTNARPGLSYHNFGLAMDCAFQGSDPYLTTCSPQDHAQKWGIYGKIVTEYGFKWGGNFRLRNGSHDLPHAEMSFGLRIEECLELYSSGGLRAVWAQLDRIRNVEVGINWQF